MVMLDNIKIRIFMCNLFDNITDKFFKTFLS